MEETFQTAMRPLLPSNRQLSVSVATGTDADPPCHWSVPPFRRKLHASLANSLDAELIGGVGIRAQMGPTLLTSYKALVRHFWPKVSGRPLEMCDGETQDIGWRTRRGELVTLRVREKGRRAIDGVEGIVFAWLHPNNLIEIGELWAPVDDGAPVPDHP